MQYEIVIKSNRWCLCYTCLPRTAPAAHTAQKMAPGTGTDAPPVAQCLLTNTWPKTSPAQYIQANNENTKKQYNNT